jgi:Tfp pilus assembly pilus retraction ATPase PilT
MKFVMRQDPDVIVLGELRSSETYQAAIDAAASGHLVLSTIHSSDVFDAVERIVNSFDSTRQGYVRLQLTNVIKAIVGLRLIQEKYGKGCVPATEILFGTLQLKKLLQSGNPIEVKFALEKGSAYGMHTFDQDLLRLSEAGAITPNEALNSATNPNDLRLKLQGQSTGSETSK